MQKIKEDAKVEMTKTIPTCGTTINYIEEDNTINTEE